MQTRSCMKSAIHLNKTADCTVASEQEEQKQETAHRRFLGGMLGIGGGKSGERDVVSWHAVVGICRTNAICVYPLDNSGSQFLMKSQLTWETSSGVTGRRCRREVC